MMTTIKVTSNPATTPAPTARRRPHTLPMTDAAGNTQTPLPTTPAEQE